MNPTITQTDKAMLPSERRAIWSLSLIYMVRMIGLFIVLPVFSLYADDYAGSTALLTGIAIGIYGLFQAGLQIPLGMLSDRIGRKPVITLGLVLLCLGSVVAAMSETIHGVIIGRALQGAGAIAATLMALAADLSRVEKRTQVMATLGASIGLAFILALLLGPLLLGWYSIAGLFWITAIAAVLSIVLLHVIVPSPTRCGFSADTGARAASLRTLAGDRQLLRLDASIFMLHLLITAVFFAVPLALRDAGLASDVHWQIYLPAVMLGIALMIPLIIHAERRAMRGVMLLCVVGLAISQLLFAVPALLDGPGVLFLLLIGITVFFWFMNTLEALLPSLVSRLAPAASRGSAMGLYSSSQFLGAFVGGAGAGALYGSVGATGLFLTIVLLCLAWAWILSGLQPPRRLTTQRRELTLDERRRVPAVLAELEALPGVEEAVISVEEGVAYLKVDKAVSLQARTG